MTKKFDVGQINKDILNAINDVISSYGCPPIAHDTDAFELRCEDGTPPKVVEFRGLSGPSMNEQQAESEL